MPKRAVDALVVLVLLAIPTAFVALTVATHVLLLSLL